MSVKCLKQSSGKFHISASSSCHLPPDGSVKIEQEYAPKEISFYISQQIGDTKCLLFTK